MRYETLSTEPLDIGLLNDFPDQGWVVAEGVAYHDGCDTGYLRTAMDLSSSTEWSFELTIVSIASGSVYISVNGTNGSSKTTSGTFTDTITVTGANSDVRIYATGEAVVRLLKVYSEDQYVKGVTLSFNEDADKWVTDYSYVPEFMAKFVDKFFHFEDGKMWEANSNPIRNSFFGKKYPSIVTFYINTEPQQVKNFHNIKVNSNKPWSITDIEIRPIEGKSKGQRSRIKKGNFKNIQGQWQADFLKDMNDPRFVNELQALMNGADLQGTVMKVTMEINEESEVRLLSVQTTVSPQQYTY